MDVPRWLWRLDAAVFVGAALVLALGPYWLAAPLFAGCGAWLWLIPGRRKDPPPVTELVCPHCGWRYDPAAYVGRPGVPHNPYHLVPPHTDAAAAAPEPGCCPGDGQCPRGAADRRPLWHELDGDPPARSEEAGRFRDPETER